MRENDHKEHNKTLYELLPPKPWSRDAAYAEVLTPFHDDEVVIDQLYSGRTPQTVQEWRGFPLVDIEARLVGVGGKIDVQDFVWAGLGDNLISDRLLRILHEESLIGVDACSVTLTNVEIGTIDLSEDPQYQPPKLYRLVAKGIVQRAPAQVAPPDPDWSLVLDLETWDGSDLCVVWGSWGLVFISQRLVDCLRRHSVRNYRVLPGHEFTVRGHRYIAFRTDG